MSTAGGHQELKEMATLPKETEFSNKDAMPEDLDGQWMRLSSFRRKAGSIPHFRAGDGVIPSKKHCSCQERGVTPGAIRAATTHPGSHTSHSRQGTCQPGSQGEEGCPSGKYWGASEGVGGGGGGEDEAEAAGARAAAAVASYHQEHEKEEAKQDKNNNNNKENTEDLLGGTFP